MYLTSLKVTSHCFILTQMNIKCLATDSYKNGIGGLYTNLIINIKPWMAKKEQEMMRDTNAHLFLILSMLNRFVVVVVVEMSYFS